MITIEQEAVPLLLSVILPAIGAMTFIVRHFWLKAKCFELLKQRVESYEVQAEKDRKTHHDIYDRVNCMATDLAHMKGTLDTMAREREYRTP